ncbi:MAG: hypothetical protein AAGA30_04535, partial [Planctomycetota bacterium]
VLPNLKSVANYVFVDDVVQGHLLAAEKGRSGQQYILGGENLGFQEWLQLIEAESNRPARIIQLPTTLVLAYSYFSYAAGWMRGSDSPRLSPEFARKYLRDYRLSSGKAIEELGYQITPLPEAVKKTLNWRVGAGDIAR